MLGYLKLFWLAAIAFVTSLILIFGGTQEQANQIAGVILQGATLLAYCIGEGFADGKAAQTVVPEVIYPLDDAGVEDDEEDDLNDDKYWD